MISTFVLKHRVNSVAACLVVTASARAFSCVQGVFQRGFQRSASLACNYPDRHRLTLKDQSSYGDKIHENMK